MAGFLKRHVEHSISSDSAKCVDLIIFSTCCTSDCAQHDPWSISTIRDCWYASQCRATVVPQSTGRVHQSTLRAGSLAARHDSQANFCVGEPVEDFGNLTIGVAQDLRCDNGDYIILLGGGAKIDKGGEFVFVAWWGEIRDSSDHRLFFVVDGCDTELSLFVVASMTELRPSIHLHYRKIFAFVDSEMWAIRGSIDVGRHLCERFVRQLLQNPHRFGVCPNSRTERRGCETRWPNCRCQ